MGKMKGSFHPVLICMLLFPTPLSAVETIRLGGEAGWSNLDRIDAVTLAEGRGGYRELVLREQSYDTRNEGLDMLLHFDGAPFHDSAGYYLVGEEHEAQFVRSGKFGSGAAKFERKDGGLTLEPKGETKALFGESMVEHSFSIEFWLYPLHLGDGEVVLSWKGRNVLKDRLHLQSIRAVIEKRVLTWDFSRIFFSSGFRPRTVSISGRDKLIPREWHHHLLTFDSRTGLLEYLVDGEPEAVHYVTDTGGEEGTVHLPFIGKSSDEHLSLGTEYDGKIDELRITRSHVEEPLLQPFAYRKGVATTELIDLETFGSRLLSISAETATPPETDIFFFYRMFDTVEQSITNEIPWIPFTPGQELPGEGRGRYTQLKFELYPDGVGTASPSLSSLTLSFEPNPPPLSPSYVRAKPGDGRVFLQWNPTIEDDTAGYLVYYGSRPGVYRGDEAEAGESPIDVGGATEAVIDGLSNGKVYYFSVASYDSAGKKNRSPLSDEVSVRPTPYAEEE